MQPGLTAQIRFQSLDFGVICMEAIAKPLNRDVVFGKNRAGVRTFENVSI